MEGADIVYSSHQPCQVGDLAPSLCRDFALTSLFLVPPGHALRAAGEERGLRSPATLDSSSGLVALSLGSWESSDALS